MASGPAPSIANVLLSPNVSKTGYAKLTLQTDDALADPASSLFLGHRSLDPPGDVKESPAAHSLPTLDRLVPCPGQGVEGGFGFPG